MGASCDKLWTQRLWKPWGGGVTGVRGAMWRHVRRMC